MTVYICNPETDVALACNTVSYTPPKAIDDVRIGFALLPSLYAQQGDTIAVADELLCHLDKNASLYKLALKKSISIEGIDTLGKDTDRHISSIVPWGWNKALSHRLLNAGVGRSLLPDENCLKTLRELSDRSTTARIIKNSNEEFCKYPHKVFLPATPVIAVNLPEIEETLRLYGKCAIKAPWSSSGRGVFFSDLDYFPLVANPIRGILRQQGAVIMEKYYDKRLDCAAEWECKEGDVRFIGWSVFKTDGKGRFMYNCIGSNDVLRQIIENNAPHCNLDNVMDFHKRILLHNFADKYNGVIGIDMMALKSGELHPLVEINLRHTMGWLAIKIHEKITDPSYRDLIDCVPFMREIEHADQFNYDNNG